MTTPLLVVTTDVLGASVAINPLQILGITVAVGVVPTSCVVRTPSEAFVIPGTPATVAALFPNPLDPDGVLAAAEAYTDASIALLLASLIPPYTAGGWTFPGDASVTFELDYLGDIGFSGKGTQSGQGMRFELPTKRRAKQLIVRPAANTLITSTDFVLRKNGVDTALIVTMTAGSTALLTATADVDFGVGDFYSFHGRNTVAGGATFSAVGTWVVYWDKTQP